MMASYVKSPTELGLVTDTTGIYSMTEETWIDAMVSTGFLQFGLGDAPVGTIAERQLSLSSSKNVSWQKYLLDTIPEPGYRDHALHKIVRESIAAQLPRPDSNRHSELFKIAVEKYLIEQFVKTKDFEPIRVWLNEKIRKCASKLNPDHIKQKVQLRNIQNLVIEKVLSVLRRKGVVTNIVCELAARIGKTILFLSLAKTMQEEFCHDSMFIMAYGVGLSVKTSYKDELSKYVDFSTMEFIDAADSDAEEQYQQVIVDSKMPVVFVSLNPEAEEKYEWINQLNGTHIALLEETDFGTHTDSQVEKVEYILANKIVTRINASGTNIGRLAKAFGKNTIDEIISVPYCEVEQDPSIPNVVIRRFYNMLFNPKINKLLEDFDKDVLPNFTKILAKPRSQQKFISALFQDIFGYQPIYGFNISDCAGEEILHSMLFVGNIGNDAMNNIAEVIEAACPEHKVLVLNGDNNISNKDAEGLTKAELVRLQNGYYEGRDKLLVITNMMGTRSYSIPEIQACLFMQESGDVYPYMQKYSRCLTPGLGKKYGHIFDFAFDQSKTRNTVMSVAVEAALLIRQKSMTYPDAVRKVLNSVNIKDMISGQWINADEVIKQFEDNDKLLEIANSRTRITIEDLTSEDREDLGELAKRSTNSKKEQSNIDKVVATGKTFESNTKTSSGHPKKDPLKAIVEKAIRTINGSATTILALANYQGESFLECIDIIENNTEMHKEFIELYGIKPASIKRLSPRLEISTLDMIVRMSKYNTTQKHIENNALAILKDDAKLWIEILGNRELKRFIKSKHCKKILVVAGGHGSEVDVFVDMFGVDILDKIVYNDKYNFFCNQIKRKYPSITVMKGDFSEMEFDMKFDVVVGNPPFQKDGKGRAEKLWPKFIAKSFELTNDGGFVSLITPTSWTSGSKNILKGSTGVLHDIFHKYDVQKIDLDVSNYFPTVGIKIGYFIATKAPNSGTTNLNGQVVDLRNFDILPSDSDNFNIKFGILDKTINFFDKFNTVSYTGGGGNRNDGDDLPSNTKHIKTYVRGGNLNEVFYAYFDTIQNPKHASKRKVIVPISGAEKFMPFVDDIGIPFSISSYIIELDKTDTYDGAVSVFNSKFFKFLIQEYRTSGFIQVQIVKNLPKLPMSSVMSDADIYAVMGLTDNEIAYVESTIK